jgi:hypothetical protein
MGGEAGASLLVAGVTPQGLDMLERLQVPAANRRDRGDVTHE